jgi:hypothetical protein
MINTIKSEVDRISINLKLKLDTLGSKLTDANISGFIEHVLVFATVQQWDSIFHLQDWSVLKHDFLDCYHKC